jgi:hypothetical protein
MAQDEKKGGFFSRFKNGGAPAHEEPAIKTETPPAIQPQNRSVAATPESRSSLVSAAQPKAPVVPKPVAAPATEPAVDTVEAFNRYCSALVAIGTSQLKVVEMTLSMLSNSLNKLIDGSKPKK